MNKKVPLKYSFKEDILAFIYGLLCPLFWILLIFCGIHIILYYIFCIKSKGYFDSESIQYAIYIILGSFAVCLLIEIK